MASATNAIVGGDCTDANGNYAAQVPPANGYSVYFFPPSNHYGSQQTSGVNVTAGQTTALNAVLPPAAGP